ncbi:hypothetical protein Cni_G22649 [Canna indica]|uniref:Secreted protein n=1 Tax=Canna indica TaxID=4628 RepID=A0AAQ3KS71_9LILI|nr:hypothetical protein Cni_G22649 [Canna indica]
MAGLRAWLVVPLLRGHRGAVLSDVADGAGGEGLDGADKPLLQGLPPPAGKDLQVLRLRRDPPEAGHPAGAGHHRAVEGVDNADTEPGHTEVLGEAVDDVDEVPVAAGVVLDDLDDAHEADKCSAVDITRRRSGSPST